MITRLRLILEAGALRIPRNVEFLSHGSKAGRRRFSANNRNMREATAMKRLHSSTISTRTLLLGASAIAGVTALAVMPAMSQQQRVGGAAEVKNMQLVGDDDLQARSTYTPVIQRQGYRYIAYIGHHGGTNQVAKPVNPMTGQAEFNGTSIIDVTDPKQPKYLAHIPGDE